MLVIARKVGEELKIGDDIIVKIISLEKNQIKIGIDAPRDISILRMELVKEIINQNKLANQNTDETTIHSLHNLIKGKNES